MVTTDPQLCHLSISKYDDGVTHWQSQAGVDTEELLDPKFADNCEALRTIVDSTSREDLSLLAEQVRLLTRLIYVLFVYFPETGQFLGRGRVCFTEFTYGD